VAWACWPLADAGAESRSLPRFTHTACPPGQAVVMLPLGTHAASGTGLTGATTRRTIGQRGKFLAAMLPCAENRR